MAKSTNYRGIHISVTYAMGYEYYEISQINKGKKWNDKTLFVTLKEAKMYIDEHYDELIKNESKKSARKSLKESKTNYLTVEEFCNLCAKVFIHYEIWSFDGHNIYEESYDLSKIKYSSYKNHDVLMWDFDKDVLILYIENNAIPF